MLSKAIACLMEMREVSVHFLGEGHFFFENVRFYRS